MKAGRLLLLGALAVIVVLAIVVLTGGSSGATYKLTFETAGQLVNDNSVTVGGRRVGKITDIRLTNDNQAVVTVEIEEPYAPLHEGSSAVIRATSLSGVANRYIALTPGPEGAPEIPVGSTLPVENTTTIVDLDQLFNTLDPKTTAGLTKLIRGFGAWYAGRGKDANRAAPYLAPALRATTGLVEDLNADQPALQAMVRNTSSVMGTLAAKGPVLTDLVSNANTTLGAIADENQSLAEALDYLPQTLRRANTTFVNLRYTLDDVDQLVAATKPVTGDLDTLLTELEPVLQEGTPVFANLSKTVSQKGANNDFTDAMKTAPKLQKAASTSFPDSIEAINVSLSNQTFFRTYGPELVGLLRDFGQSTSNYDANGHYARATPIFNAFQYNGSSLDYVGDSRNAGISNGIARTVADPGVAAVA
ncbi:MAG: MlaD family protein, partial [Solirubrobacterales bacterium]